MTDADLYSKSRKLLDNPKALCNIMRRIAIDAGEILLDYHEEAGLIDVNKKSDGTPVTEADEKAEAFIRERLYEVASDIPFVGEEAIAAGNASDITDHRCFWMVDALDGTRAFIAGDNDFTVNIALISDGAPVIGVVYAPAHGELYAGCGEGTALRHMLDTGREKFIHVRHVPREGCVVYASRTHGSKERLDEFLTRFKVSKTMRRSSSIKLCLVAAGKADLSPRFGPTSEWDTAAADAVLRAAGGMITDLAGAPLRYGKYTESFLNPEFVAASFEWFAQEE